MPPIDLNPHDLKIVLAILRKFVPDREVWAFGSRVKWTAKPFSDLDLAIVGEQSLPISIAADLAEAFDESELPIKVDVVDWATTSDAFRKIIEKDKVVVQAQPTGAVVSAPTFSIPAHWESTTLGEICRRGGGGIQTGPFGSQLHASDYVAVGVPSVMPTNIGDNRIIEDGIARITDADANRLGQHKLQVGDIIYSRRGDVEKRALVREREVGWICGTGCLKVRLGKGVIDPLFASLFLGQQEIREWIVRHAVGATMANLNTKIMSAVPVALPPLNEQHAIAQILGTLDDKIELNRCMNANLEATARVIFKSWFVDFDPVRDKVNGKRPFGLDGSDATLFPDELLESDVGEIPSNWKATTLADIVTERTGKVGNGNEHVVLSAVASGELKLSDEHFTKQVYSQDTSKYKRVEQWDYAYNPSRINIGSIGMLEEPIVGAVSPVYTVLRPAEGYERFLRFFLDLPQTKEVINQFCSGSVRQSLSFKDFAAIPVVLPPKEIAKAFTRRWQELKALRQKLAMQSNKLAELRDTLLPKLMSGELRVPDELMA